MTAPDAAPRADAEEDVVPHTHLELAALRLDWRADDLERGNNPMPNTVRGLREEATVVRAAAAVVAAARAWRRSPVWTNSPHVDLIRAVDAYEAALPGGRG